VRESELAALTLVRATCLKRVEDAALLAMLQVRVMISAGKCYRTGEGRVVPSLLSQQPRTESKELLLLFVML